MIIRNTILYNLVFIVLGTVCDVEVAVILNDIVSKRRKKTYQTILLVAYLVNGFLASDTGFINNYIMEPLGLAPISFYAETKYWPFILTFINLWKGVGYSCIIYLANIGGIDPGYYEAASLDGAARWQRFLHITLPCLKPTIITLTILSIGKMFYSDFGLFYQVPMQSGTLFPVTQTIDTYVFYGLMNNGNIGMSAAAGLYQSVVGFVLVLATNAAVNKTILILMCIACLAPFLLLIASSFTSETALIANGYSFWPQELSLKAYQYLLQDSSVFRAYGVTLLLTAVGTTLSILVTTMIAYPLSMSSLPGRGMISFYVFFTMLFAGGLVPAYMMWTQTFHIKNTFLALLLPNLVTNGFIIMMMCSYFQANIPKEVLESARMDGARETFILFRIVIPMSCALPGFEADIDTWVSEMLQGKLPKEELDRRLVMCEENLREEEIEAGELGNFVNLYEDEKIARVQEASTGPLGPCWILQGTQDAVKQCVSHGCAKDEKEAAKLSIMQGGDMDMSSLAYYRYLEELVQEGEIEEEVIDRVMLSKEHRNNALEVGKRCAVLLKNDGILPILGNTKKILVTGALAEDKQALLGSWDPCNPGGLASWDRMREYYCGNSLWAL